MPEPFADPAGRYLVLINEEGQHSLWPVFADVPAGWRTARRADTYEAALEHVEGTWTDLRPNSLIRTMGDGPA